MIALERRINDRVDGFSIILCQVRSSKADQCAHGVGFSKWRVSRFPCQILIGIQANFILTLPPQFRPTSTSLSGTTTFSKTQNLNMLPAVAQDVLSANPNFDALYRDLCANRLNANATTKIDAKVQKERNAFDEVGANHTGTFFNFSTRLEREGN